MRSTRKLTFRAKQGQRALRRATPHVGQARPGAPGGSAAGEPRGPRPERSGAEPSPPSEPEPQPGRPRRCRPRSATPAAPFQRPAAPSEMLAGRHCALPCPVPSRGRLRGETHLLRRCPAWGLASGAAGRLDPAAASAAAASHGGAALIAGTSRRSQARWVWKPVTTCQDGVAPNPPPWERGEDLSELGKPGPLPRSEGQRLPRAPRPGPALPAGPAGSRGARGAGATRAKASAAPRRARQRGARGRLNSKETLASRKNKPVSLESRFPG